MSLAKDLEDLVELLGGKERIAARPGGMDVVGLLQFEDCYGAYVWILKPNLLKEFGRAVVGSLHDLTFLTGGVLTAAA